MERPHFNKAVVLLSGGLDSATTLYCAKSLGYTCHCLILDYGQRHRREIEAAKKVARAAGCSFDVVPLRFPWKGSALTDRDISVPTGRSLKQMAQGIPATYVPARNTIFLSLALGCAEAIGAQSIFIGANAIDYSLAQGSPILIRGKGYVPIEDCRPGDLTLSMNSSTLHLEWCSIAHVIQHPYIGQPIYRLVTEQGREVVVSEGHSLYGLSETGDVCPVVVNQLRPGDYIVSAGRAPFLSESAPEVKLIDLLSGSQNTFVSHPDVPRWIGRYRNEQERYWKKASLVPLEIFQSRFRGLVEDKTILVCAKTRGKRRGIPAAFTLTKDWAFFLGLWLADGSYGGPRTVNISCNAAEAQPALRTVAEFFHTEVGVRPNGIDRGISSRLLVSTMKALGFIGTSRTKQIPSLVLEWPSSLQAAFIKGYIVGDGSIDPRGPITMSSVNAKLLGQFQDFLLHFGVVAYRRTIHMKKNNFTGGPTTLFSLVIENSQDKKLLLDATGQFDKQTKIHMTRSKIHGIPVYSKLNAQLKSFQAGRTITKIKNAIRNNAIYDQSRFQRNLLERLLPVVPDVVLRKRWGKLVDNDIIFSKVRSKELVRYDGQYIYDLSIPGNENFICNGVVAHNSGYPDCRPAYYRAMQKAACLGTKAGVEGKGIRIVTPLIRKTKAEIIRLGMKLDVPYQLTWSCYLGGRQPCGRCDSCLLRRKGFQEVGLADPAGGRALPS